MTMTEPETKMIQSSLFPTDQLIVSYHVEVGETSARPEAEVKTIEVPKAEQIEMDLADQHLPETEIAEIDLHLEIPAPASSDYQMSLPAALCDELLIEEINSIPNKMGFKIGEVADMLAIKQYVLRYWESEFDVLKPKKAANNQRYYTRKDVENAYLIRKLLHRDRFSIEGARSAMKELKTFVRAEVKKEKAISNMSQTLDHLDDQVDDLLLQIRKTAALF